MKLLRFSLFAFTLVFLGACNKNTAKMSSAEFLGEAFAVSNVITYDQLLATIQTKKEMNNIVVEGKVGAVCQAKGCFMNMVSDNSDDAKQMFVKFKDYGFFMPKDLTDGRVVMKGNAFVEETSVEDLRHYAKDEGKSDAEIMAITEPMMELKFMASGVKILQN